METRYYFRKYELVSKIGAGGMGAVYLARETLGAGTARNVVLKTIRSVSRDSDPGEHNAALLDDGTLAAVVRDSVSDDIGRDNIVVIYDILEEDSIIVMEYIPGRSLDDVLRQLSLTQGHSATTPAVAAMLLSQACRGFHRVHGAVDKYGHPMAVVHRDVKPGNLMATQSGVIKIIDFGIATANHRRTSMTPDGELKGTPQYMAPERWRGEAATPASDIFSLGAILYRLLTGRKLFDEKLHSFQFANGTRGITIPPDLPSGVTPLLQTALAADPKDRNFSALEFAELLEDFARKENAGILPAPTECAKHLTELGVDLSPFRGEAIEAPPTIPDVRPRSVDDALVLVPPPGFADHHVLSDGRVLTLYSLGVRATSIYPLYIDLPQVLPTVLEARALAGQGVEFRVGTAAVKSRWAIYGDSLRRSSKKETVLVTGNARNGQFDLLHRDGGQRLTVTYHSARPDRKGRPVLTLDKFTTSLTTRAEAQQLACLVVDTPQKVHAVCVTVADN